MLDTVMPMVGNHNGKGIPSKRALCFPEKGGRKFGVKIWEEACRWDLDDLMDFVFPQEYSPVHHQIAVDYLNYLIERGETTIRDKHEFCEKYGHSMNTLRKNVIPKLYRLGLIHRTRELPKDTPLKHNTTRKSIEHESLSFSTFLRKIANEWEATVNTGRMKRGYQRLQEKDRENEIQKQERLEWERYLREEGID